MHKQIIATMAVSDLARSRALSSALGHTFDPLLSNRTSTATPGSLRRWAASRRNKWQDGDGRKKTRIAAGFFLLLISGGEDGNRTRLNGFAGRCITSLLPRLRNCFDCLPAHRETGAGEESRTLDLNLGKVALYQLSYSRMELY